MTTKLLDKPRPVDHSRFDVEMARLIAEWAAEQVERQVRL